MLSLASQTDPAWARRASENVDEVLLDHAHCEKKAASTAINLIFRYPNYPGLMIPLSELAREELEHFEQVVSLIRKRGLEFVRQKPSPYAGRLLAEVRTFEPMRLLDMLLCCSLIEARSCERMQLLAEELTDPDLRELYKGLLACEARHHATYVDLARDLELVPEDELRARLTELAQHEARVLEAAPDVPRMHN
jgi:tRNA-(ms[2]io[6]A)-hydroxylase